MSLPKQTIVIEMLEDGFLVRRLNMDFRLAGLTTGRDLCEWIAKWSGAKVDIFEAYEAHEKPQPPVAEDDETVIEAVNPIPVELDYATPPQEPQDSDPKPEADGVPDELENAPEVIAEAEERQTLDAKADRFAILLEKKGAAKKWVKASYTDISIELNVTAPIVKSVIDRAKEMFPNLRQVRVMSGESQGNNFTFNPDIPEPDEKLPDELASQLSESYKRKHGIKSDLTESQRRVLAHLQLATAKNGNRVQIENATLAGKAGVPKGSIYYVAEKLEQAGFITIERPGNGIAPFFTVTEAGMQVAA